MIDNDYLTQSPLGAKYDEHEVVSKIDPVFRVNLHALTAGDGIYMSIARTAVSFHERLCSLASFPFRFVVPNVFFLSSSVLIFTNTTDLLIIAEYSSGSHRPSCSSSQHPSGSVGASSLPVNSPLMSSPLSFHSPAPTNS